MIDAFFSKLCAILAKQIRRKRPIMDERKLDVTMEESLGEQQVH